MTRTRQTKGATSSKSSAFARHGVERRAQKPEPCFHAIGNKNAGNAQFFALPATRKAMTADKALQKKLEQTHAPE